MSTAYFRVHGRLPPPRAGEVPASDGSFVPRSPEPLAPCARSWLGLEPWGGRMKRRRRVADPLDTRACDDELREPGLRRASHSHDPNVPLACFPTDGLGLVGLVVRRSTADGRARSQKQEFERWGPLVKRVGFNGDS